MTDREFSRLIRARDGRCAMRVRCRGSWYQEGELHCAHFHGRWKKSVRFDDRNAVALCPLCHAWVDHTDEGRRYFRQFMRDRLGAAYDNLAAAAEALACESPQDTRDERPL